MDFVELEAIEGLRWSWNSWPTTKQEAASLLIPLSVMYKPLTHFAELPQLQYDPLICVHCNAVLNPYSRVDYTSRIWICAFCNTKNAFPRSYSGISENNLPAELFPTYSTVEYVKRSPLQPAATAPGSNSSPRLRISPNGAGWGSSSSLRSLGSSASFGSGVTAAAEVRGVAAAFVFVVDCCAPEDEIRALKSELLLVLTRLPENALVGLVTFDGMVQVRDIGYSDCSRVVVFHGERQLSSEQVQNFLGVHRLKQQQYGKSPLSQKQSFLMPLSECEFNITSAIEEIRSSLQVVPGHRPLRCTGAAISAATGLLEACSVNTGSRIMLFTSGPATVGPGIVVDSYLGNSIRTHRDLINGRAKHYDKTSNFYLQISQRLSESSIVLDLFACSLNQVGAAELRSAVERSGGFMMFGESFDSDQFRKSLRHIFTHDEDGALKMCFDATIELVTTSDLKICGALGPCVSLQKRNNLVSDKEIGEAGTCMWKMGTLTNRTCFAFFFQVNASEKKIQPGSAFFLQFITRYRYGDMGIRKRVTTVARRWVGKNSAEIAAGFDQEAAASVIARMAIHRAERCYARDVIRWLDDTVVRFASKFGG
uniref:Protein transport protein SEC23 n=1 Tax=Kalanchoe fedtschenkoi TaxID=63787 RepID=A0A7N0UCD6_KALFE